VAGSIPAGPTFLNLLTLGRYLINPKIKTLIFDLGGVILDLSVDHTLQAFSKLFHIEHQEVTAIYHKGGDFELYEKGEIDDHQFRNFIRNTFSEVTDDEIDRCWNAMLLGIPASKLQLLKKLMDSYHVILLSNTNNIHLQYINRMIMPALGATSLDPFFHRTYYSHLMRMRKPDAEIFLKVLADNNLNPEQTLFLDDNKLNVEGANTVGINTLHVTNPDLIFDYFHG
jgi:glucose-1-phosphatase